MFSPQHTVRPADFLIPSVCSPGGSSRAPSPAPKPPAYSLLRVQVPGLGGDEERCAVEPPLSPASTGAGAAEVRSPNRRRQDSNCSSSNAALEGDCAAQWGGGRFGSGSLNGGSTALDEPDAAGQHPHEPLCAPTASPAGHCNATPPAAQLACTPAGLGSGSGRWGGSPAVTPGSARSSAASGQSAAEQQVEVLEARLLAEQQARRELQRRLAEQRTEAELQRQALGEQYEAQLAGLRRELEGHAAAAAAAASSLSVSRSLQPGGEQGAWLPCTWGIWVSMFRAPVYPVPHPRPAPAPPCPQTP